MKQSRVDSPEKHIQYHELVVETLKLKKDLTNYEMRQLIYSQLVLAKLLEERSR